MQVSGLAQRGRLSAASTSRNSPSESTILPQGKNKNIMTSLARGETGSNRLAQASSVISRMPLHSQSV